MQDAAQFQYGTPTPGPLPTTGLDVAPLGALGGLLLVAGVVVAVIVRRWR
jgi:hypothetical protein